MKKLKELKSLLINSDSIKEKISIINDIENNLKKSSNFKELLAYQSQKIELLKEVDDSQLLYEAIISYSNVLNILGRYDDAMEQLAIAENGVTEKSLLLKIQNLKGIIYLKLGKNEESKNIYTDIISNSKSENDCPEVAKAYMMLGVLNRNSYNYIESYKMFSESYLIFKSLKFHAQTANLLVWLGNVQDDLGDLESAIKCLFEALEISKEFDIAQNLGNIYNTIGSIYIQLKEYDLAKENLLLALEQFQQMNIDYKIADVYMNLGLIEKNLENTVKALNYFQKSIDIRGNTDIQMNRPTLAFIADIYLTKKDISKTEKTIQKAKEIALETGLQDIPPSLYITEWKLAHMKNDEKLYQELGVIIEEKLKQWPKNIITRYFKLKKEILEEKGLHKELVDFFEMKFQYYEQIDNNQKTLFKDYIQAKFDAQDKLNKLIEKQNENQRLKDLNTKLKEAQDEIVLLEKRNTVLAMGVTINHEIRQPLTIMNGCIELLEYDKNLTKSQRDLVEKIKTNQDKIIDLVDKYHDNIDFEVTNYAGKIKMLKFKEN